MNFALVKIRLKQIERELLASGILYILLLAGAAVFGVAALYKLYLNYPLYGSAGFVLMVLSLHISRKDTNFVYAQLSEPQRIIFTEYFMLSLPFSAPVLFTPLWYCFFIMAAGLAFIPFINFSTSRRTRLKTLGRFLYAKDFEWISGVRKYFYGLLFLYAGALAFCWLPGLPLLFLWIFTGIIASFYLNCEPLPLLWAESLNAKIFLRNKTARAVKMLLVIFLPVLILNTIFQPHLWWINLLFPLLLCMIVVFAILFKYSLYRPNDNLNGSSIILAIVQFSAVMPFLLPLPFLLIIRNYKRAKNNLKFYLHD